MPLKLLRKLDSGTLGQGSLCKYVYNATTQRVEVQRLQLRIGHERLTLNAVVSTFISFSA